MKRTSIEKLNEKVRRRQAQYDELYARAKAAQVRVIRRYDPLLLAAHYAIVAAKRARREASRGAR